MQKILNFYLDDSGTRRPDRKANSTPKHGHDWFALGGILINEESCETAKQYIENFTDKWRITYPLHSNEIRAKSKNFLWLGKVPDHVRILFIQDLTDLLNRLDITGLACVIDRQGYQDRYLERYNGKPWMLCKTAYTIAVERAAKIAQYHNKKLRVFVEKCNRREDSWIEKYHSEIKENGLPFSKETSAKYTPLNKNELRTTLYDLKFKTKASKLMQIADLYLWPICMGGYEKENIAYKSLLESGRLIECHLPKDMMEICGTKYSCFKI